jgi:hypothetical protein
MKARLATTPTEPPISAYCAYCACSAAASSCAFGSFVACPMLFGRVHAKETMTQE